LPPRYVARLPVTETRDMIQDGLAMQALERIDQLDIVCAGMSIGDDGAKFRKMLYDRWKEQAGIGTEPEKKDTRQQWHDLKMTLLGGSVG